jgi:hypothetical protein
VSGQVNKFMRLAPRRVDGSCFSLAMKEAERHMHLVEMGKVREREVFGVKKRVAQMYSSG